MNTGVNNHFDLKVGYGCNNKCIHCVVETSRLQLVEDKVNTNQSYREIIDVIESDEFKNSSSITITGGEPTLRRDFTRIIKYITDRYPEKRINIQTNGRLLGQYLSYLKSISNKISYTIAIHSMDENLHNAIVNTEYDNINNPFKETLNSLEILKDLYGDFKSVARIEIVISSMNYKNVPDTVKWLIENDFNSIGMSYPHLDGFYEYFGKSKVREIGVSYKNMREILPELYKIGKMNPNSILLFEEVPLCMWRDEQDKLLEPLGNIKAMRIKNESVFVKFIHRDLISFNDIWKNMHSYTEKCSVCAYKNFCEGVWYESAITFGSEGFSPISEEEYLKIEGCNRCF